MKSVEGSLLQPCGSPGNLLENLDSASHGHRRIGDMNDLLRPDILETLLGKESAILSPIRAGNDIGRLYTEYLHFDVLAGSMLYFHMGNLALSSDSPVEAPPIDTDYIVESETPCPVCHGNYLNEDEERICCGTKPEIGKEDDVIQPLYQSSDGRQIVFFHLNVEAGTASYLENDQKTAVLRGLSARSREGQN